MAKIVIQKSGIFCVLRYAEIARREKLGYAVHFAFACFPVQLLREVWLNVFLVAETEQDSDVFSSRTLQLVQQLTTDTEAAQKLVAASINNMDTSVETAA